LGADRDARKYPVGVIGEPVMILTVDVGTSVLKAALFHRSGIPAVRAEAGITLLRNPDPTRHEVDAQEWVSALRQATAGLGLPGGGKVDAVVVSGNSPTLVPVAADGTPLSNAITWMDRRSVEEARIVAERRRCPIDASFFLPKALWLLRNQPDVYGRARWLFSCPEYLSFLLTGSAATFLPTPGYERSIMWDAEAVRSLGMDPEKFPPFLASGRLLGDVSSAGMEIAGVPRGTPVFAGAPDYIVSLLGTGTVVPGRACLRAGTSEGINLCSPTGIRDPRLLCVEHIATGCYNVSGFISTSGKALEWFKAAMGRREQSYDSLFDDAARVPPGSNRLLFLPYLAGERAPIWDPDARGAFIGLTLNHARPEMTRAVLESVAFAIRDVIEVMQEAGASVEDLRITGRPSRSAAWNQIKADVTGRRILVPSQPDSDLAGDVCLALFGLGEFESVAAASQSIVTMGASFEPDAGRGRIYDAMFGLYRESYRGLRSVFAKLQAQRSAS
jgi:xylulokinase